MTEAQATTMIVLLTDLNQYMELISRNFPVVVGMFLALIWSVSWIKR